MLKVFTSFFTQGQGQRNIMKVTQGHHGEESFKCRQKPLKSFKVMPRLPLCHSKQNLDKISAKKKLCGKIGHLG